MCTSLKYEYKIFDDVLVNDGAPITGLCFYQKFGFSI